MEAHRVEREKIQLERERLFYDNLDKLEALPPGVAIPQLQPPQPPMQPPPVLLLTGLPHTRKVQQYSPDGDYVMTHPSIADAARAGGTHRNFILESDEKQVLIKGFRWRVLATEEDDQVVELPPLAKSTKRRTGLVVKLNGPKSSIVDAFKNSKTAGDSVGCGNDTISRHMRRNSKFDGHFWAGWDDCSVELREAYIREHGEPSISFSNSAKSVRQLDKDTGEVVGLPASMMVLVTQLQTSHKYLKQAIADRTVLRGFRWEWNDVSR